MRSHALTAAVLSSSLLPACSAPTVLHRYGWSMPSFPDQCHGGLHPGVDFSARVGAPVLAAADGEVASVKETETGGGVLLLRHGEFERYTAYAHLDWSDGQPAVGQSIRRGQIIGRVGMYRNSGRTPHVHMELCTSACSWGHPECTLEGTEDPLLVSSGCFNAQSSYTRDTLILTYPVSC